MSKSKNKKSDKKNAPKLHFISISDKCACARRELNRRTKVFPERVAKYKMSGIEADLEIAIMRAIMDDYCFLEAQEKKRAGDSL